MRLNKSQYLKFQLALILALSSPCFAGYGQVQDFDQVDWVKEKITKGVTWKHVHTSQLFDGPQNINILIINTRKRDLTLVYDKDKNRPTSELSAEAGALAAVNAGFFDMKNGGSVTYIKVDGIVPDEDTSKWRRNEQLNGAFIIDTLGNFGIELAKENRDYSDNSLFDDVLVTGSLLIDEGKKVNLPKVSFVEKRHPRTCLGMTSKKEVILVTVDGRAKEALGMSLYELADLMLSLDCSDAINLDGGGSTTMWINERGGVVNKPSDNNTFDHEGERNVSNVLIVK